jgi:DNA polymerase-1
MTHASQTFFLLDGHALSYRAYFGMMKQAKRLQTRQGLPTGAIYGFARILIDLIKTAQPHLLAVCFDLPDPTHRHADFADYKGHRDPPPDDLIRQFPYIEQLVQAFGIPTYKRPGYEADDLIGSLATQAVQQGYTVKIITGDRDLFQLIQPGLSVLLPNNGTSELNEFHAEQVHAKYGYHPHQVVDYKALAGDSSDNIPGVRGIGDKSAIKLLERWNSLENIYANLAQVEEKFRKKLEEGRADAFLSQKLARILTGPEAATFDPTRSQLEQPDKSELLALLQELEFNSILNDLPSLFQYFQESETSMGTLAQVTQVQKLSPTPLIPANLDEVKTLATALATAPFAFDTETTGLHALDTELVGLSFAIPGPDGSTDASQARSWYVPVGHTQLMDQDRVLDRDKTLALLKDVFENPSCPKYAHNAKFDVHVLSIYGVIVAGLCDDTMLIDYLLQPENKHGLKDLARTCLNLEMQEISDLIGSGRKQITMAEVEIDAAAPYAAADAVATQALRSHLRPQLDATPFIDLYRNIELPMVSVLARMEQRGVSLDSKFLQQLSQQLDQQLRSLETRIYEQAGESFNLNSPKQMGTILFEKMNLSAKGIKKNKSGGYSTDVSTLEKLQHTHPVIQHILEYRQLIKLKNTYVDTLPELINPRTGRIHTSFNQSVAATGRLSSSDPNLQNIPIRTELGRQIRRAFIPSDPGWVMASFDYSQIELRLLAHFSGDARFGEAFAHDRDIHAQTAVEIFGLSSLEDVTSEMRRIAKTTNFGIVYGQTAYGLANTLGIPNSEAMRMIQRFKERYNGIQSYMDSTLAFARTHGYVETIFKRRRYIEDINHPTRNMREFAERTAINSPLQGSASDLIKRAMVHIDEWLYAENIQARMLLQVHDELVFEIPEDQLDTLIPEIRNRMEQVVSLSVPLRVDVNTGATWMDAK